MSLLKTEPASEVQSLEELFAIAFALEQEAAERYAELAQRMQETGHPGLAAVFLDLSAQEQGHRDSVVNWSQKVEGRAPDPAKIRWELPETFDDEGAATSNPDLLNAYRALSTAVRNEERAFAFWSYVAAYADKPEIRRAAETMAQEELGHVATLRRERRKAFHQQRGAEGSRSTDASHGAAALESRLADLLDVLAAKASAPERERLENFAHEARRRSAELTHVDLPLVIDESVNAPPQQPLALAEYLVDRYLEAGDRVNDDEALARVQSLAGPAIARLAWLRADLPELRK